MGAPRPTHPHIHAGTDACTPGSARTKHRWLYWGLLRLQRPWPAKGARHS